VRASTPKQASAKNGFLCSGEPVKAAASRRTPKAAFGRRAKAHENHAGYRRAETPRFRPAAYSGRTAVSSLFLKQSTATAEEARQTIGKTENAASFVLGKASEKLGNAADSNLDRSW
jgi:hypothetical protein